PELPGSDGGTAVGPAARLESVVLSGAGKRKPGNAASRKSAWCTPCPRAGGEFWLLALTSPTTRKVVLSDQCPVSAPCPSRGAKKKWDGGWISGAGNEDDRQTGGRAGLIGIGTIRQVISGTGRRGRPV